MQSILPKAVRELAQELTRLPAIGPKTAQRLAIYLLRQSATDVGHLADIIKNLHQSVHVCRTCFNLADEETCFICRDQTRDKSLLCIVEDPLDVEAIERTGSFTGLYHVLGGVLSPIEGIGVKQLTFAELFERLSEGTFTEIIIALDPTMESEATARHITANIPEKGIKVTRLARGLPTGGDIEFADALTLSAALSGRKTL
jgi:recombination protein RecR